MGSDRRPSEAVLSILISIQMVYNLFILFHSMRISKSICFYDVFKYYLSKLLFYITFRAFVLYSVFMERHQNWPKNHDSNDVTFGYGFVCCCEHSCHAFDRFHPSMLSMSPMLRWLSYLRCLLSVDPPSQGRGRSPVDRIFFWEVAKIFLTFKQLMEYVLKAQNRRISALNYNSYPYIKSLDEIFDNTSKLVDRNESQLSFV